ncbi:MAG: outer membrane beta-barrel domain-containing protein [Thioalkalispiraceae bacterium]
MLSSMAVYAQEPTEQPTPSTGPTTNEIIQQDPVIQPEIKRREVKQADIDTENFEIGAFVGFLSIEDFGTNPVYGASLDYHITEDLFLQSRLGISEAGTTSFERLGGGVTLLNDDQREYLYYNISLGYNLLPGEAFVTRDSAYNTSLYVIVGAGNTDFAGDNYFTINWGAGYAITLSDWFAVHMDFRDHMFDINITGEDKTSHNLEATLDLTFYF